MPPGSLTSQSRSVRATRRRRTRMLVAGLVGVAGLVATACSGSTEANVRPGDGSTPTTEEPRPLIWPLTGEPVSDPSVTEVSAAVAKIDNDPQAWPHQAVNTADVVFEVWVEGITRLAAVFHSDVPDRVGPVRSGRSTDIDLVSNLGRPLLVFSGGNPGVLGQIGEAQAFGILINASQDAAPGFYERDNSRFAPYNLYADAAGLRTELSPDPDEFPSPLWEYRDAGSQAPGDPAAGLSINFGPGATVNYVWDDDAGCSRRYERGEIVTDAAGDIPVCATNVLVLNTPYGQSVVDSRSPQAYTIGAGDGWLFSGGRLQPLRWDRPEGGDGYNLVAVGGTGAGEPVELAIGNTWVAMPPVGQDTEILDDDTAAGIVLGAGSP